MYLNNLDKAKFLGLLFSSSFTFHHAKMETFLYILMPGII